MFRRSFITLVVVASVVSSLAIAAGALAGGNAANVAKCQKGGWLTAQTSTGEAFASQDDCVEYGAEGGVVFKPSLVATPKVVGVEQDSALTASGFHASATAEVHIAALGGGSITMPATTDASGSRKFYSAFTASACANGITGAEITFTDSFGLHASAVITLDCA